MASARCWVHLVGQNNCKPTNPRREMQSAAQERTAGLKALSANGATPRRPMQTGQHPSDRPTLLITAYNCLEPPTRSDRSTLSSNTLR
eukprot:5453116-Alexandrium_andersonii.AAC.1